MLHRLVTLDHLLLQYEYLLFLLCLGVRTERVEWITNTYSSEDIILVLDDGGLLKSVVTVALRSWDKYSKTRFMLNCISS